MVEVIECEEFEELSIRVSALLEGGELKLDDRITSKGYLAAAMKGGQITLRATKFVGTIPLTDKISVKIKPRASIANLSFMLVRSGVIPTAIAGFTRGYMPRCKRRRRLTWFQLDGLKFQGSRSSIFA